MVKEVSIVIRDVIIQEWKGNINGTLSQKQIGENFKIPKSTVNNIIQKYKNRVPLSIYKEGAENRFSLRGKLGPWFTK